MYFFSESLMREHGDWTDSSKLIWIVLLSNNNKEEQQPRIIRKDEDIRVYMKLGRACFFEGGGAIYNEKPIVRVAGKHRGVDEGIQERVIKQTSTRPGKAAACDRPAGRK